MKKIFSRLVSLFLGFAILLFAFLVLSLLFLAIPSFKQSRQIIGVSFSPAESETLGIPWQETYQALLTDLKVKHLRLSAYWNVIEPQKDIYDFTQLDEEMNQAAAAGADVILSIGRKLPRWPECYVPAYASQLSEKEQQERVYAMLEVVVKRYQNHPALRMWQVENEPLLAFGVCPPADKQFLQEEINVVHSLDAHQVLVTDSGEKHWWLKASSFGDVFGTTMYRTVFSGRINGPFSYDYIYPAWFYRLKGRLVLLWNGKETIISELQGEPWGSKGTQLLSPQERAESFSVKRFIQIDNFAARTQFAAAYWWGVEYWYWEKVHEKNPAFWDTAKTIFQEGR